MCRPCNGAPWTDPKLEGSNWCSLEGYKLYGEDRPCDVPQFFKMPVLMLMIITVLNDGTLITVAYDHVIPSREPEKWNLKALWLISVVLSVVALGSSILLLWAALDSWNDNGIFRKMGLPPMHYSQIIALMYLKVGNLTIHCSTAAFCCVCHIYRVW